jgi:hypothetical protein
MAVQDFQTAGEIRIDTDPPLVSREAGGAWVQAWVWVDNDRFDNGEGDR